jgi:prolyl oligopeptidase
MSDRTRASVLACIVGAALCWGPAALADEVTAPVARKQPVSDSYHGVRVTDPYRWLENPASPEVQAWSAAQTARTRHYLDGLPYRQKIFDRLYQQTAAASPSFYALYAAGNRIFALYNQPPKNQPMIAMLPGDADVARLQIVVDPNTINPKGTTAIDWYVPSPDGTLLAVSLSENGSEVGSVHIFEVASGRQVYEVLPRVQYPTGGGSLAWRADARGFWYTRYPGKERPLADRHFYQAVYFHELGQDPARDKYVFGKGLPKIAEIALENRQNLHYVLATVANGDGGEYAHYLIDQHSRVRQLTHFSDAVVAATVGPDEAIYLVSRKGAPRGKLLKLAMADPVLAHGQLLVPESDAVLQPGGEFGGVPVVITGRAIYVRQIIGGPSRVAIFDPQGKPQGTLPLPEVAAVEELEPLGGGMLLYEIETYLRPPYFARFDETTGKVAETGLAQTSPVSFEDTEVMRCVFRSIVTGDSGLM